MGKKIENVAVVGAGSWGTAVANLFADGKSHTVLWGRDPGVVSSINEKHENEKFLKGIPLNGALRATSELKDAVASADIVVCSIPTQQIRAAFEPVKGLLKGKIVVNTSKGIEIGTHKRVSEVFREIAPTAVYSILSGPTFALEVAKRLPAAATIACENAEVGERLQQTLSGNYFRAYTSTDVVGVELAGALKNVVAIATGMVSGLNLGFNAQAALINRGIAELLRMGRHFGADPMTFLGLAGTGDLILTCTGPLSRNRMLGVKLGQGGKLEAVLKELGGVAEGYYTARSVFELAQSIGIVMPIAEEVFRILYEGRTAQRSLVELMGRDLKSEWDAPQFP